MRGRIRWFHWCATGMALCMPGIVLAAEVPPTTTAIFQAVTDEWYPAMTLVFGSVAAILVVFWAWRTVKGYIGRRTQRA